MKSSVFRTLLTLAIILFFGFLSQDVFAQSSWAAPKSADAVSNPYKGNEKATAAGKKLYVQMCAICHGNKGKGDGIAGMSLKPRPADLTKPAVQNQSDGAIYWKITNGNPPMASYKETLTEEQRWQLVNYIRELKR